MKAKELARNVDPITRQYIDAAVEEAMQPLRSLAAQVHGLSQKVDQLQQSIPQPIDAQHIENEVARGLHAQIQAVRQEAVSVREGVRSQIEAALARVEERVESMIARFDQVSHRLDTYVEGERYQLTRAQVMRAMRETGRERNNPSNR